MENNDMIGVLGPMADERSSRDQVVLSEFGCVKEGYESDVGIIGPCTEQRSARDQQMLAEFNHCNEGYMNYRRNKNIYYRQKAQITPERFEDSGMANINDNPYNPTRNVKYTTLG